MTEFAQLCCEIWSLPCTQVKQEADLSARQMELSPYMFCLRMSDVWQEHVAEWLEQLSGKASYMATPIDLMKPVS